MEVKKNKNKVAIFALTALLGVGLIAGTLAAFNASFTVGNVFKVGQPNGKFVEEFNTPTADIIYGGEFKKTGAVYNLGDADIYAKATIESAWSDPAAFNGVLTGTGGQTGATYAATLDFGTTASVTGFQPTNMGVASSLTEGGNWRYNEVAGGFLYYGASDVAVTEQAAIPKDGVSSALLDKVTFADNEAVPGVGKYYVAADWNAAENKPKDGAAAYDTQDAAAAEAAKSADNKGKIFFYQEQTYEYADYKGTLTVTITCELQDTPFTAVP